MNTYKWTCKGCETPNVLVHDFEKAEQIALNCLKCGTPGLFEPVSQTVIMQGYQPADVIDTASTQMQLSMIDSAQSIARAGEPRIDIDYSSPQRIVKMKPGYWRV